MKTQFLRFVIVGVLSTIVNYACFYILFKFCSVNYLVASALGFIAGVFAGYSLNKAWTFEVTKSEAKYLHKYGLIYCLSLILSVMILKVLVAQLYLAPEIANIIAIGVTTCTNFLGVKFIVFKK